MEKKVAGLETGWMDDEKVLAENRKKKKNKEN